MDDPRSLLWFPVFIFVFPVFCLCLYRFCKWGYKVWKQRQERKTLEALDLAEFPALDAIDRSFARGMELASGRITIEELQLRELPAAVLDAFTAAIVEEVKKIK